MSQVNHNYDYITTVDGFTVWERLRVIRNFLNERRKALKLAYLHKDRFEATKSSMDEWDLKEAEILNEGNDDLIKDCEDEIAFLDKFEYALALEAEKTRIDGMSDREMYELNYPLEKKERVIHKFKSEVLSFGQVTPDTMLTVMRDPLILNSLVDLKLINSEFVASIQSTQPPIQKLLEKMDVIDLKLEHNK